MWNRALIALSLGGLAACGAGRAVTRPDDMTAQEHRSAASRHDREGMSAGPYVRGGGYWGGYWGGGHRHDRWGPHWSSSYYPWTYYWNPGAEHFDEASEHAAAAETLETRYRAACAMVAPEAAAASPLDRFALGAEPIEGGVLIHVSREAGPPDVLLAEIRCHRAWLSLETRPGSGLDLIAVRGVEYMVHAGKDTIEIMATSKDARVVPELRRLADRAVEAARRASRSASR